MWDEAFLSQLSIMLGGDCHLEIGKRISPNIPQSGELLFPIGGASEPSVWLSWRPDNAPLTALGFFNDSMRFFMLLLIAISLSISAWVWLSIMRPLNRITNALNGKSPAPLDELIKEKNELGQISRLIVDFFDQEKQLRRMGLERQTLIQNLHDHLIQRLFACGLQIQAITRALPETMKSEQISLNRLREEINKAVQEVREQIQQSLRDNPDAVAPEKLHALIQGWLDTLQRSSGIHFALEMEDAALDGADAGKAGHLLGVVRESTSNAARHSQASNVVVRIGRSGNSVICTIKDNGQGFSQENNTSSLNLGLANMRRRAHHCEGTLKIDTQQGKGTEVVLTIPL